MAARVLGRRTALKYLGYGVGSAVIATVLSACSGESFADKTAGTAFSKFMVGTWTITAGGASHYKGGTLKVEKGGSWSMALSLRDEDGSDKSSGGWTVSGGKLRITIDDDDDQAVASKVPDAVADKASASINWTLFSGDPDESASSDGRSETIDAAWSSSNSTLTLKRGHAGGAMSIVAVRR